MKFIKTSLAGAFILEPKVASDQRGSFVKIFNQEVFSDNGLDFVPRESYFSVSKKNVIRGMHFQTPPDDHTKLIYVIRGAITDVVLDIRSGSPTFGKFVTFDLSAKNHSMVYIPSGFAHGFLSLVDDTLVVYLQTTGYSPDHDGGVRFDSFGLNWAVKSPILSDRDQAFPALDDFKTPFRYDR